MLSIAIFIFDNVEILDFSGPYEVFSAASRVHSRMTGKPALFRCHLVAAEMRPVYARGGMKVLPACVLPPVPDIDLLIVPGGEVNEVSKDAAVTDWIRAHCESAQVVASVCTGAFLLGKAGVLNGVPATTHWEDQDELQACFPEALVQQGASWIDCGKVVTSAGISAGIDMSLHLVERFAGRELAQRTAKQMEYRWNEQGRTFAAQAADTSIFFAS